MKCTICPRNCGVDRNTHVGFCGVSESPKVAKAFLHMWEEPCISGPHGSGTVFFSGCNLKCIFCQNYSISQEGFGKEITTEQLVRIFLSLQEKGAHNINLVNPTHYIRPIKEALLSAKSKGMDIPVVYNSNGYETLEGLKYMEGLVDVYLPDLKYWESETAKKFSMAPDYFEIASAAVKEMYRQVGAPVLDESGIIKKGLILRHLILPGYAVESIKILEWIKENLPGDVYVSLMSQYTPYYKASCHPEIGRRITRREYEKVLNRFIKLELENGYIQERGSAVEEYIPDFNLEGVE